MKWIYQMNRVRVSRGDKLILDDVTLVLHRREDRRGRP